MNHCFGAIAIIAVLGCQTDNHLPRDIRLSRWVSEFHIAAKKYSLTQYPAVTVRFYHRDTISELRLMYAIPSEAKDIIGVERMDYLLVYYVGDERVAREFGIYRSELGGNDVPEPAGRESACIEGEHCYEKFYFVGLDGAYTFAPIIDSTSGIRRYRLVPIDDEP